MMLHHTHTADPARRAFLKLVSFGGAALLLGLASKKIGSVFEGSSLLHTGLAEGKQTALGKNLSFVENNKETVFYDQGGATLLIFEK